MSAEVQDVAEGAVQALKLRQEYGFILGSPPVITGESSENYWELFERFQTEIQPRGLVEVLLVKDIVDFTWELNRLQRIKVEAVKNARRSAMAHILEEVLSDESFASDEVRSKCYSLARRWVNNDPEFTKPVMDTLAQSGFGIESVAAEASKITIRQVQAFDAMLSKVLKRRDAALRKIQKHRADFSAALRHKSDSETAENHSELGNEASHARMPLQ